MSDPVAGDSEPEEELSPCDSCRAAFVGKEFDAKLADELEEKHPNCACERCTVGEGSPGPVDDVETLYRLLISPRDFDGEFVAAAPFEKVSKNGLSVCRALATDSDLQNLVEDNLLRRIEEAPRRVRTILAAAAGHIRKIALEGHGRAFCIYDQTVVRRDTTKTPIPTHAGIFLRGPPKRTSDRRRLQKDMAVELRKLFLASQTDLNEFRDGFLERLNEASDQGGYILPGEPPPAE